MADWQKKITGLRMEKEALEREKQEWGQEREGSQREKQVLRNRCEALAREKQGSQREKQVLRNRCEALEREKQEWGQEREALTQQYGVLRLEKEAWGREKEVLRLEKEALQVQKEALRLEKQALELERKGAHKVTLAIYSGRPDPVWFVHSHHESFKEMKEHLDNARANNTTYRREHIPSILGYRGFLVHHPHAEEPDLIIGPKTKDLQHLLLRSMPKELELGLGALHGKISEKIKSGAVSAVASPLKESAVSWPLKHYAPKRNLARWNDQGLIQWYNNCYNYANDKITNSYAQPGYARTGYLLEKEADFTPENVIEAAKIDGLEKMDVNPTDPCPKAPKQPNCLVALVVYKGQDYHWLRLDDSGTWSHKPGTTAATNLDGDGKEIYDPRKANIAHYEFVCFMKIYTNIIDGKKPLPLPH